VQAFAKRLESGCSASSLAAWPVVPATVGVLALRQMEVPLELSPLVRQAAADERVLAVLLFGSVARGEAAPSSDIDLCIVAAAGCDDVPNASELRLEYAGRFAYDIHVFQLVPIYVRERILREHEILFVRDEDALYDLALRTGREMEDFRPLYRSYLEEVARGGS